MAAKLPDYDVLPDTPAPGDGVKRYGGYKASLADPNLLARSDKQKVYTTPIGEVRVGEEGWYRLPGTNVEVTKLPLQRSRGDGGPFFARLTWKDASDYAKSIGARLPSVLELDALAEDPATTFLSLTLQDVTGTPYGHASREKGSVDHDLNVTRKLAEAGYVGKGAVINAGKHWVDNREGKNWRNEKGEDMGSPAGPNYGFYNKKRAGDVIQGKGFRHGQNHTDPSQTTMLAREVSP
jgi:hypothetical protein